MRSATKITSIVAAVGAGALGLGLIGFGTGVGAQFIDNATGNASINVGKLACTLSSADSNVQVSANSHTATIALGTITNSTGALSAPLTITNSGSIPMVVGWAETTNGNILNGSGNIYPYSPPGNTTLEPGQASTFDIGFHWNGLDNSDEGRSGTAVYAATCNEDSSAQQTPAGMSLFEQYGGVASWDGSGAVLDLPAGINGAYPPGASAGINVLNTSAALPAKAPNFISADGSSLGGTPRLNIEFSDNSNVYGVQNGGSLAWNDFSGKLAYNDTWADVQAYATTNNLTVKSVYLVMDTSRDNKNPTTSDESTTIKCVNYSGTALFGSC